MFNYLSPYYQAGGFVNRFPGGGPVKPTTQDSIALYNNALDVINFYKNAGYTDVNSRKTDPSKIFQALDDTYSQILRRGWGVDVGRGSEPVSADMYRQNIDQFRFKQRELAIGPVNIDAPMTLYDRRIAPTATYNVQSPPHNKIGYDLANLNIYNPLDIKPQNLLTPFEREFKNSLNGQLPNLALLASTSNKLPLPAENVSAKKTVASIKKQSKYQATTLPDNQPDLSYTEPLKLPKLVIPAEKDFRHTGEYLQDYEGVPNVKVIFERINGKVVPTGYQNAVGDRIAYGENLTRQFQYPGKFQQGGNPISAKDIAAEKAFLENWYKQRGQLPQFKDISNSVLGTMRGKDYRGIETISNLDPKNSSTVIGGQVGGSYSPDTNEINIYGGYSPTTYLHELNHAVQTLNPKVLNHINGISKSLLTPLPMSEFNQDTPWNYPVESPMSKYHTNPMEYHSRMMEFRKTFDLSPNKKFTKENFKSIEKQFLDGKLNDRQSELFQSLYDYTPDNDGGKTFIDLMNSIVSTGNKSVPTAQQGGNLWDKFTTGLQSMIPGPMGVFNSIKNYGSPNPLNPIMDAMSPMQIPGNMVQATYTPGVSVGNALKGTDVKKGLIEEMLTDPLTYLGVGMGNKFVNGLKQAKTAAQAATVEREAVNGMIDDLLTKMPDNANPRANKVLQDFKDRVNSPEGISRLKILGKSEEDLNRINDIKLKQPHYSDSPAYYNGALNYIGMTDGVSGRLLNQVVRHEAEHGAQGGALTQIDKMLENLKLKSADQFDQHAPRSMTDSPTFDKALGFDMAHTPSAINYFKNGVFEKSAFLSELQQRMVDSGIIKHAYDKITPEHIKEAYSTLNGDKGLRILNIIEPTNNNFNLLARGLNKMLSYAAPVAAATALSNESRVPKHQYGGHVNSTGYTPGFDTMNNPYNIIPGGNITMQHTPMPLKGYPIYGNKIGQPTTMKPGQNYNFPGAHGVLEVPEYQMGGDPMQQMPVNPVGAYYRPPTKYLTGSGFVGDPFMAKGGGFFGNLWRGLGTAADGALSSLGMPNVIKNSGYDQLAAKQPAMNSIASLSHNILQQGLNYALPGVGQAFSTFTNGVNGFTGGNQFGGAGFNPLGGMNFGNVNFNDGDYGSSSLLSGLMPRYQYGGSADDNWIGSMLHREKIGGGYDKSSNSSFPLSNAGYNYHYGSTNKNPDSNVSDSTQAHNLFVREFLPDLQKTYRTQGERALGGSFAYGAGLDNRIYAYHEWLKEQGATGFLDRNTYREAMKHGEWKDPALKQQFDDTYNTTVGKLPAEERKRLLIKGQEFFYQNTERGVGSINENLGAYNKVWKPKILDQKRFQYGGGVGYYQEGGPAQPQPLMPIQTEKGEWLIHPDMALTKTNATELHKNMDRDEITDYIPGGYIASNDKKIKMTRKEADEILMGVKTYPYREGKKGRLPEEIYFSELFGNNKKLTPAEMTEATYKKFTTVDKRTSKIAYSRNDIFTELTNQENIKNREPWLNEITKFNESKRQQPTGTYQYGGNVPRYQQGGSPSNQSGTDWASIAASALPFITDLLGKNKSSAVDPFARNLALGSIPLNTYGLSQNVAAQKNALGTGISDFTGLGKNLNQYALGTLGASMAGILGQSKNYQRFNPAAQNAALSNFNTRTPSSVIDSLAPSYNLNSLAASLGPRGFSVAAPQLTSQYLDKRNAFAASQFNQDRGMAYNIMGQKNALDSNTQQFNIGQAEKEQQAKNQQISGVAGNVGSYFNRLGDIQSQILPITTQMNIQRAGLSGQVAMGTAQNMMSAAGILQAMQSQAPQNGGSGTQANYQKLLQMIGQNQQAQQSQISTIGQDRATTNRNQFDNYNPYQYPQQLNQLPPFAPRNTGQQYDQIGGMNWLLPQ